MGIAGAGEGKQLGMQRRGRIVGLGGKRREEKGRAEKGSPGYAPWFGQAHGRLVLNDTTLKLPWADRAFPG